MMGVKFPMLPRCFERNLFLLQIKWDKEEINSPLETLLSHSAASSLASRSSTPCPWCQAAAKLSTLPKTHGVVPSPSSELELDRSCCSDTVLHGTSSLWRCWALFPRPQCFSLLFAETFTSYTCADHAHRAAPGTFSESSTCGFRTNTHIT